MRAPVPADLDLVADLVYVVGGHMPDFFYLECGACGMESEPLREAVLAEVINWALTHHELAPV